jgi:integrase
MASIRKRAGKWQVQVRRNGYPPVTKTFTLKSDAQTWARQTETEVDQNSLPINRKELERITLADLLCRYNETVTVHKKGKAEETIRLNAFLRQDFAAYKLSALTPHQFSHYRDARLKIVGAGTVLRELSLLQAVLEVARKEWGIPILENPVRAIRKPKAPMARDRRLQDGEWDDLLNGCTKCRNKLIEPLICLAVETGMRRGEILNMKWQDLNFTNGTLHIPITKNGHSRTIPLTNAALDQLKLLLDSKTGDRIIPLSIESMKLAWRRLIAEDLPRHPFHFSKPSFIRQTTSRSCWDIEVLS